MKDIRVKKDQLIETLTVNRDAHEAEYEKAVEVYRTRVIAEMEHNLELARAGGKIVAYIQLPVPEVHTDDYTRAIEMLTWELGDEIVLSEPDFGTYVLNQWGWAKSFFANTSNYLANR